MILVLTLLLTLFLPVRIFGYATFIIYPLLVTLILYSLTSSIRGAFRKNRIDIVYLATFILLSLASVHDVRLSLGKSSVPSAYILTYTLVLFVFIQAVLILYKWVRANIEKEHSEELEL